MFVQLNEKNEVIQMCPLETPDCTIECNNNRVELGDTYKNGRLYKRSHNVDFVKKQKHRDLKRIAETKLMEVLSTYPTFEQQTFTQQYSEALLYSSNNESPVPLLSSIAAARNITIDELANKVLEKANKYQTIVGSIIGRKQQYEQAIEQCLTVEQANSIIITFD